jgi:DNA polymerase III epsilon subunit family exonuclease
MSDGLTVFIWFAVVAVVFVVPFMVYYRIKESKRREEEMLKEAMQRDKNNRTSKETKHISHQNHPEVHRAASVRTSLSEDPSIFDNELASIPLFDFELSSKFTKTNYVKEMEKVKFSRPRNNSKYSGYGNFVVIDTETTGVSVSNEIIELSAIKYENFRPVSAFTTLVKPKYSIPKEISEITHITNEMVSDSPSIFKVMPAFIDYVGDSDILGHNLEFDLEFVYKYGFKFQEQKRRYFDSLDISRSKLDGLKNYKLTTLCEYYGIARSNAHRSLSDCYATAKVFIRLLEEYTLIK